MREPLSDFITALGLLAGVGYCAWLLLGAI